MNNHKAPGQDRSQASRLTHFKSTWFAPALLFFVICSISVISFAAQTRAATMQSKENTDDLAHSAQSTIEKTYSEVEKIALDAATLYTANPAEYDQVIGVLAKERELTTDLPSIAFIGFAPSNDKENLSDANLSFIEPPRTNYAKGTSTESFVNTSIFQMVSVTTELSDARANGKPILTRPFIHHGLIEGRTTYIMLIVPVYTGLVANPTESERISTYQGSIIVPISLDILLDSAQESSGDFQVLRLIDRENNVIASSVGIENNNNKFSSTLATLANRTMRFEFNDSSKDFSEVTAARKSTLILGLGLGLIVFLLFTMMRVSEKRASRFAEKAEQEVRESEARFSALIEQSSDITLVLDQIGTLTFASPSIWFTLGYSPQDIVGKNIRSIVGAHDTIRQSIGIIRKLNRGEVVAPFEATVMTRDGQIKTFECVVNDLRDDIAVEGIVCNSRDITERKQAELQVDKAKALYENALSNAPIGVALVHQTGNVFFSNDALHDFLGLNEDEAQSIRLRDFVATDDQFAFSEMWQSLEVRGTERTTKELRFIHPDGRQRWGLISAQGVFDEEVFQYYVVQIEDTTERRSIAERLEYQAIHDPLTGLPNRLLFVDRLEVALLRAKRTGLGVAVLFLDLDRFKVVNDSLGHAAGDRLLEAVAERIKSSVRPNDTLARFGGDEFVVLCEDITDESQTQEISERLLESLNRPIMLMEGEVYVTASIGIARSLTGEDTPETILRDADTAMYRAKDAGRNRAEVFDERTHARAVANLETGNGMFRALGEQEFRVHYQPIISLASGRLSGFEALVYWEHPERGHIGPSEFIALAEETGIIVPLGLDIFEKACNDLVRWHSMSTQASHLTMSINLSPRQLSEPNFVGEIQEILERTRVNPARIWFEITESALMVDADSTIAMLDQLRHLGVHFEVDDFGTGFSSLSYLKKFPVDALKIDRGFIDGLGREPEDSAIVTAVVSLSHALGLQAIAEGVETPLQMAELKTLGCEYAQGYLFARPAHASHWDTSVTSKELFTFAEPPAS